MATALHGNVRWSGADSLRIPVERSRNKNIVACLQTYGELDLGTVAASPYTLDNQQAGASLITVNPTVALNIIFPVCEPGQQTIIQNTNATNAIQASVSGNTANSATVGTSSVAVVVQTGTNGGIILVSGT